MHEGSTGIAHALIFAGGTGSRLRGASVPKQFLELAGKPIIAHTIDHFERHPDVDDIIVVCLESWIEELRAIITRYDYEKIAAITPGGDNSQASIYNGLRAIDGSGPIGPEDIVLVHDGVRPLIDGETITRTIASVRERGATATVSPASETIIEVGEGPDARDATIIDRSRCLLARAPQGFSLKPFLEAHERAIHDGKLDFIDSISLMAHYGYEIFTVEGPIDNIKITTRRDFFAFKGYMDYKEMGQLW